MYLDVKSFLNGSMQVMYSLMTDNLFQFKQKTVASNIIWRIQDLTRRSATSLS